MLVAFHFKNFKDVPIHFLLFPFYYKAVELRKSFISRTVEKRQYFDLKSINCFMYCVKVTLGFGK